MQAGASAGVCCALVACVVASVACPDPARDIWHGLHGAPGHVTASIRRQRQTMSDLGGRMTQDFWERMMRVNIDVFNEILGKVHDRIEKDAVQAARSSGGVILPEQPHGPAGGALLPNVVGALDGILVAIRKPTLEEHSNPAAFFTRKGYHALNVQAICDARRRFLFASCTTPGATHDSVAWALTQMAALLEDMHEMFYVLGDPAYVGNARVLTGWKGRNLSERQNNFNYFLSSVRMNIECAFGILVARWGILWKPLRHSYGKAQSIILCCMILHNLCINRMGSDKPISPPHKLDLDDRPYIDPETGGVPSMKNDNTNTDGVWTASPTTSMTVLRERLAYICEVKKMRRPKNARPHG
eukprot:CAMPEP_0114114314 /NCGR_PEP_ID=MMETSP0043_2-20121206/3370_1 /TAXON_ID=464988 /ORGANISM="Hemiselmis andersenii, Strain CCMP644" /LENGTH=356 /DNA_ID=CAMNT_0001206503 /DNA_START=1 /DNA_END=1071 /DNA_ORIENTATION=+